MSITPLELFPPDIDFDFFSLQLFKWVLVIAGVLLIWIGIRLIFVAPIRNKVEQDNPDLYHWISRTDILSRLSLLAALILFSVFGPYLPSGFDMVLPLIRAIMYLWVVVIVLTLACSFRELLELSNINRHVKSPEMLTLIAFCGYIVGLMFSLQYGLKFYHAVLVIVPDYSPVWKQAGGAVSLIAFLSVAFWVIKSEKNQRAEAAGGSSQILQHISGPGSSGGSYIINIMLAGDPDLLLDAIKQGADVNERTQEGKIPLNEAIKHKLGGMVEVLLANGGRTDLEDLEGWTPLTLATYTGQMKIVQQLLNKGADPNAASAHGWAPLTWALHCGYKEIETVLLQQGAQEGESYQYRWIRFPDRIAILNFLLNLYRLQIGARPDSAQRFFPNNFAPDVAEMSYRLEVDIDGKWLSRIVSLSMLGEGSGSKSRCYKVIFDSIWVVKIPPTPITRFEDYIEAINTESRTMEELSEYFVCIAPGISDIVKKIAGFPQSSQRTRAEAERYAAAWLSENPGFHKYLKIDNGFAFFMDISKYTFLNQYIEKLHSANLEARLKEELARQPELISDYVSLENKYGEENGPLYLRLNECWSQFEAELSRLLKETETPANVSVHKMKTWFVAHLFQQPLDLEKAGLSPELTKKITGLLRSLSKAYKKSLAAYRKLVIDRIRAQNFKQNAPQMAGIISNLLSLLVKLRERGISMRDLKPDNLFVVEEAEDFSLGIIDFETAVHIQEDGGISRSFLGGTPSYATPSHLFNNQILAGLFEPVTDIYYYQDWYAVVGMIYGAVTGSMLFEQTARELMRVVKRIRKQEDKSIANLQRCFQSESTRFWKSVWKEFGQKTRSSAERLQAVTLNVPNDFRRLLLDDCQRQQQRNNQQIKSVIDTESPFGDPQINRQILQISFQDVKKMRDNWEKNINVPQVKPAKRKKILAFLGTLAALKQQVDILTGHIRRLQADTFRVDAKTLMEMILACVYRGMYQSEWQIPEMSEKKAPPREPPIPAASRDTTLQEDDATLGITVSTI